MELIQFSNKRKLVNNEYNYSIESPKKLKNEVVNHIEILPIEILLRIIDYLNISDINRLCQVNKSMLNIFKKNKHFQNIISKKTPKNCNLSQIVGSSFELFFETRDIYESAVELKNGEIFGSYPSKPELTLNFTKNQSLKCQNSTLFINDHLMCLANFYDKNLIIYENRIYDMSFKQIFDFGKISIYENDHFRFWLSEFVIVDDLIVIGTMSKKVNCCPAKRWCDNNNTCYETTIKVYRLDDGQEVFETRSNKHMARMQYNGEYIIATYSNYTTTNRQHRYYDNEIYNKYKIYFYKLDRSEDGMKYN